MKSVLKAGGYCCGYCG